MAKRIAIVGGGIAGVTSAWQLAELAREGADVDVRLFESSGRLGGIVETVRQAGFTIECGPDAWVSEKPWARDLVGELGLADELLPSNDSIRKTHILIDGRLETMPDGMRMMVPTDLGALEESKIFSAEAKRAFHDEVARAEELRMGAAGRAGDSDAEDESIASFTRRHFGEEVLRRIAEPLLSGVLGGDVETLSVRAVMPQFVAMEREHGSLVAALGGRASRGGGGSIFTTLRSGLGSLIDRMASSVPRSWLRLNTAVTETARGQGGWQVCTRGADAPEIFDAVFLAVPPHVARELLGPVDAGAAELLPTESSSAIIVALAFTDAGDLVLPAGFGFLVPPGSGNSLLACTFVDQKFDGRVPPGGRLLRAFFGGARAEDLLGRSDGELVEFARRELTRVLGPLPAASMGVVRRWPKSLPQYAVGHLGRMAALNRRLDALPGLTLLGNGYRGVGLPDLIRDARQAARGVASS